MPDLILNNEDLAVISMSLLLAERLLLKSRYEPEVQKALAERIKWLLDYIKRRAAYSDDFNSDNT